MNGHFQKFHYHYRDTKNGGPVHWISENYQCKDLCKTDEHNCCLDVGVCKADSVLMEDDPNVGF